MLLACPDDRRTRCGASIALALLSVILSLFAFIGNNEAQLYKEGEQIRFKVNKLTSTKTLMAMDYYRLPFCMPEGELQLENMNIGQYLIGDRIHASKIDVRMRQDEYCKQICLSNLGPSEGTLPNKMTESIYNEYHQNFLVDGMSVASIAEDDSTIITRYWQGVPIGFVDPDADQAYVFNHLNINMQYHKHWNGQYEVVRAKVEPFSIRHEFEVPPPDESPNPATITQPISSCNATMTPKRHIDYYMVSAYGQYQPASGVALFTYDVTWQENVYLSLRERWDIFLSMDDAIPIKVHLTSIGNSVFVLFVAMIVIITLWRRNISGYRRVLSSRATDGLSQDADEVESGWKALQGDIFRPPPHPLLLAIFCGTGAHLLSCMVIVVGLSIIPWFPGQRGLLVLRSLLVYAVTGFINGYVSMRYYKTFGGNLTFKFVGFVAATGYPMVAFGVLCALSVLFYTMESTYVISVTSFVTIILLWLVVSIPMVLGGSFVACRTAPIRLPLKSQENTRDIPGITGRRICGLIAFCLFPIPPILWPFGCIFVELYLSLASVWMGYSYNTFGIMLIVIAVAMITNVTVAIMFDFFLMLKYEDYRWWWSTFLVAGSTGVFVLGYSAIFYHQFEATGWFSFVMYFGYMSLASFSLLLMFGFVGFSAGLWFNCQLYAVFEDEPTDSGTLEMSETAATATEDESRATFA